MNDYIYIGQKKFSRELRCKNCGSLMEHVESTGSGTSEEHLYACDNIGNCTLTVTTYENSDEQMWEE